MNAEVPSPAFSDFFSESSFSKADRIVESAWIQHVPFAFWLTEQLKPKLLVELGVHTGVSYFAFCQSIKTNKLSTLCYGVDTWMGDAHSGLYDENIWLDVSSYNATLYNAFSYLLKTTFNEALQYFEAGSIELLHIDGYHTYEAVKEDFESWLPKMAANGIVLFHDIVVREREFGVYKFWNELKQQYKSFEFIHGHGLGILALGEPSSDRLAQLFALTQEAEINQVRAIYARLGAVQAESFHAMTLQNQLAHINAHYASLQHQYEQLKLQYQSLNNEYEVLKKLREEGDGLTISSEAGVVTPAPSEETL